MAESPDDMLVADSKQEAVYVSRQGEDKAIAIGDESKEEWIIAPTAYDVDLFR
jgi:hypothetical protein